MNRLQLATLLSWTGDSGMQGRKRLQKVVFFLQHAGCQLDCLFTLHHFGPYSRDVADACDEMVGAGLIQEHGGPSAGAMLYSYSLAPATRVLLDQTPYSTMQPYQELGKNLISEDLWHLELGSTILFYFKQSGDWTEALNKAYEFKKVAASQSQSCEALDLAKRVMAVSMGK